jgi:hypothetical protein
MSWVCGIGMNWRGQTWSNIKPRETQLSITHAQGIFLGKAKLAYLKQKEIKHGVPCAVPPFFDSRQMIPKRSRKTQFEDIIAWNKTFFYPRPTWTSWTWTAHVDSAGLEAPLDHVEVT